MGAAQPSITTIKIHRNVRSYRDVHQHRSVFQAIHRIADQLMSVPGEERPVLSTRDATVTLDTSVGGRLGLPVTRYIRSTKTLAAAAAGITGLEFPTRIGQDAFLLKSDANVTDDLHENLRDV